VALLAAALACATAVPVLEARAVDALEIVPSGDIACIDGSHVEDYYRDSWTEDGLAGLHLNLMRSGMQPLRMDTFDRDRLARARMLFVIAPRRTFSDDEADAVEEFVRGGGYAVVSAGADSADALAPLLERFGLVIRNRPLGPFVTPCEPLGGDVQMRVAWGVEDEHGDGQVFAWSWFGEPKTVAAMIESRLGGRAAGGLLLIGDGQFLLNKNLEPEKQPPLMHNVRFLRRLVERTRAMPSQGGAP
jgi:hypothetical protein